MRSGRVSRVVAYVRVPPSKCEGVHVCVCVVWCGVDALARSKPMVGVLMPFLGQYWSLHECSPMEPRAERSRRRALRRSLPRITHGPHIARLPYATLRLGSLLLSLSQAKARKVAKLDVDAQLPRLRH